MSYLHAELDKRFSGCLWRNDGVEMQVTETGGWRARGDEGLHKGVKGDIAKDYTERDRGGVAGVRISKVEADGERKSCFALFRIELIDTHHATDRDDGLRGRRNGEGRLWVAGGLALASERGINEHHLCRGAR